MKKATRTMTVITFCLISALACVAGPEALRFDGRWQVWYTSSQSKSYVMELSGDRFHAVDGAQWYKGEIVVDAEADPARFDFIIRECDCGFVGKTSTGIFRWDGDAIEIRAPTPGDPRPTEFDKQSGETMRLVRVGD